MNKPLISTVLLLQLGFAALAKESLKQIVDLKGSWRFSIGNMPECAAENYYDNDWDNIMVPGTWEQQGYADYIGYAWYRTKFMISDKYAAVRLYMCLGLIDDVDEVYLNGKMLNGRGQFPPAYISAYNAFRKYFIPPEMINANGLNQIAIKVYDGYLSGGILGEEIGIYASAYSELLEINLEGQWDFSTINMPSPYDINKNADKWEQLMVPLSWENQGHEQYNGYAWYRKAFL
ncbi:MAG: hypothetical protein HC896_13545 [Bacteroidales bacterium]|nr:hypothetical protein [Bacteroidales bacterium]